MVTIQIFIDKRRITKVKPILYFRIYQLGKFSTRSIKIYLYISLGINLTISFQMSAYGYWSSDNHFWIH